MSSEYEPDPLPAAVIEWHRVLQARAEAGDRRAEAALARHPLSSPAWLTDRGPAAFPCRITDWVLTYPLGREPRRDDETVHEWALRECKAMGMNLMEAAAWMREVLDRG